MNRFDLTGEVAVVIGGTGVLGGALAEGLAQAGANVAVLGRNAERGAARVNAIKTSGGHAAFFSADATSRDSLHTAHQAIEKSLGAPTILLNAAGGTDPKVTVTADRAVEQIALEDWRANFDLNLVGGVLLPCQEFGPAMVKRGKGSIINIASVSGACSAVARRGVFGGQSGGVEPDAISGAGVGAKGVRVNSITPGFFPGEQNRRLLFNEDGTPTARAQAIFGHTPMGRFGKAEELIGAAIFLASHNASSFVTGTDIRVDGGFLSQTI